MNRHLRRLLLRVLTAAQLTRLTLAFGAISDLWLVVLLSRRDPLYASLPVATGNLVLLLAGALFVAVGLFAFGASLNDVLDARHDRALSPAKPIPAGRIRPEQAAIVTSVCLAVATLAAFVFGPGAVAAVVIVALGIVFYNAAAKHVPAAGFVTIGLVHAAHMAIPNPLLSFTLPLWLSMSHATVIAVLVHRLEDKRPAATMGSYVATAVGWMFWSTVLLSWGWMRGATSLTSLAAFGPGASPLGFLWPAAAVVAFTITAILKSRNADRMSAAEKLRRYGAMWQSLYGVAWLLAANRPREAVLLGGVAAGGFATMTLLKEFSALVAAPVNYREE